MASKNLRAALSSRNVPTAAQDDEDVNLPFGESLRKQMEQKALNEPLREVEIDKLLDNPYQRLARSSTDAAALKELADSIQSVGFHGALLARPKSNQAGHFELAFGHRRRMAAQLAGLTALPVKVLDLSDEQMLLIMAGENFSRLDLDPLHEAMVVGEIATTKNLSAREIALKIGKGQSWVVQRLNLYNAPDDVQELVKKSPNKLGHVQLLVPIKDKAIRTQLIQEIIDNDLTQAQLTERVRQLKTPSTPASSIPADSLVGSTPTISTSALASPLAANPSPAAPSLTNPTTAAIPSAVPTPMSPAGAGSAPSPASAGSSPHTQQPQPQPQPPAPMPGQAAAVAGVVQFPTSAQQPSQPQPQTPPTSGAGVSGTGPNKGVSTSVPATSGFATITEYLAAEAETDPATTINPGDYYSHGDPGEDGAGEGFNSYDLDDFTGASTAIEDYLSQPASQWGLPIAEFAVALAKLTNLSYVPSNLAEITTEEWELLNRLAHQLQVVLGSFS